MGDAPPGSTPLGQRQRKRCGCVVQAARLHVSFCRAVASRWAISGEPPELREATASNTTRGRRGLFSRKHTQRSRRTMTNLRTTSKPEPRTAHNEQRFDASSLLPLLTAREAADVLKISERTLWTLTKVKDIPAVKVGHSVRYDQADLAKWIAGRKTA